MKFAILSTFALFNLIAAAPTPNTAIEKRDPGNGGHYQCFKQSYEAYECVYTTCYTGMVQPVGYVDTWWGGVGDAGWACNNWMDLCENQCWAQPA
ncbi:hypothetical protein HDV00_009809 [Rhizophlyctis rosea]|nr:hypothetical protein HDV00_009809 [Rhizophlyctis rosea]